MRTQVTLSLPEETYQRAQQLAQLMHRDVADVMAETLSLSLPRLTGMKMKTTAVANLSNVEILHLADLQMEPADDQRLSQLLDQQQAGNLAPAEQTELMHLMQLYQSLLLRKAEGLAEAVQRDLRAPLAA
jgi:hypothetical protein